MITYEDIKKKYFIPFSLGMIGILFSIYIISIGIINIMLLSLENGIYLLMAGIWLLSLFYIYVFINLKDKIVNG